MRKRTGFVLFALALAAVVSLTFANVGAGKTARPNATVTLEFWNGFTGPDRPALEAIVKRFNATHDDIQIKMSIMPWDVFYEKLLPSFAANKGPAIVGMASEQMQQYADRGVFAPIGDVYKRGLNKNTLVRSAVAAGLW